MCQSVGCHSILIHITHHSLTPPKCSQMNIGHCCQETGINTRVEGGNLIKRLEKRYYSLDINIHQGSVEQGEQPDVSLFINLHSRRNKAGGKPGLILMRLNCLKCHFFPRLLETSCRYIWFHISLFLTMKYQSMCSSLPALTSPPPGRLLRAVPKKINCFWNAGKPTAASHKRHTRREKMPDC